jgi:putative flippase GtrA
VTLAQRVRESQFLRFALIGGMGFLVNEAALYLAIHVLGLNPYAGGIVAFLVTVTFTWFGNRMLTFAHEAAHGAAGIVTEWAKFVAANALGFVVNYAVYASLVRFAPTPLNSPYVALAFGTLSGLIFNFTLSKRFVFRAAD